MQRIDSLFFGYCEFKFNKTDRAKIVNLLLENCVSREIYEDVFCVNLRERKKIEKLLAGKVEFTVSAPRGVLPFLYSFKKRFGLLFGLLISIFLVLFSSHLVWDVRIEGVEKEEGELIKQELSELGFSVGQRWSLIDKSEIETEMLIKSDLVSWININRRGSVAYVSVISKITHEEEVYRGYSNVVATKNAIIEEITVKKGVALVKAGETVKAGQVLISGVIPKELGGGFCYADGEVLGRYSETKTIEVDRVYTEKIEINSDLKSLSVNFFDFSIKLLEKYRNYTGECDIIKEKCNLNLFGVDLPFSVFKEKIVFYENVQACHEDAEMIRLANSKMREEINSENKDATLLRIKTYGELTERGYKLKADFVSSSEIGMHLGFEYVN